MTKHHLNNLNLLMFAILIRTLPKIVINLCTFYSRWLFKEKILSFSKTLVTRNIKQSSPRPAVSTDRRLYVSNSRLSSECGGKEHIIYFSLLHASPSFLTLSKCINDVQCSTSRGLPGPIGLVN